MQELNHTKFTDDDLIREVLWENHSVDQGVDRYKASLESKSFDDTDQGTKIIRSTITALINNIQQSYIEAEETLIKKSGGAPTPWHFLIGLVNAEQTAVITIKKALEYIGTNEARKNQQSTTTLATQIGEALRQQMMFENWKVNSHIQSKLDGYNKSYASILIERAKGQVHRNTISNWKRKFAEYEDIEWGNDAIVVGAKLIDLLLKAAPETFNMETKLIKGKSVRLFTLTDQASKAVAESQDMMSLNRPFLLPTLIEPMDWAYIDGKIVGGYHHLKQPLFTSGKHKHTAGDNCAASPEFLESINTIQKTSWSINTWMLSVIEMLYGTKSPHGDIPQLTTVDVLDRLTTDEYHALSDEDKKAYHTKRRTQLEANESAKGKHAAFQRKLSIAHKMSEHAEFYFPHFSDFRGRLYPMSQELNPQSDQVGRSLLKFTNGQALGASGLYWLKVHLANLYGKDKETFEERVSWASSVIKSGELAECVDAPLDGGLFTEADEPLTFLAAAKELVDAYESGSPETYISHIPVAMDGVCNGMQLLSLLGKDEIGAQKTNCSADPIRYDLYTEVADEVMNIINAERDDNEVAEDWFHKLNGNKTAQRKTVKRGVMTSPYGVSTRGIQTQLIGDKHCNDMNSSRDVAAQYMTYCIQTAMTKVNGKAVEIMAWLQEASRVITGNGQEVVWNTPLGLRVTQGYWYADKKKIKTVLGEIILWKTDTDLGLDHKKNAGAMSPNFIHSLDAAMLQLTAIKMNEKGFQDFSFIHDSYGAHASTIEELHITLREAAHELFSQDILAEFKASLEVRNNVELPELPVPGNYDINAIHKASYFFS